VQYAPSLIHVFTSDIQVVPLELGIGVGGVGKFGKTYKALLVGIETVTSGIVAGTGKATCWQGPPDVVPQMAE
jgi:hypothetical protein